MPFLIDAKLYTEAAVWRHSVKKVFKNITKFTRKHLCQSLFFNRLQACMLHFIAWSLFNTAGSTGHSVAPGGSRGKASEVPAILRYLRLLLFTSWVLKKKKQNAISKYNIKDLRSVVNICSFGNRLSYPNTAILLVYFFYKMMKLVLFSTENHVWYVLWTSFSHPSTIENH